MNLSLMCAAKNVEELSRLVKNFPHTPMCYGYHWLFKGKARLVALILYYAGVKSVNLGHGYKSGDKKLEHLLFHDYSVIVKPFIPSPDKESHNLFYFLLKRLNIGYSGGASDDPVKGYMQASWTDKEGFIADLIVAFQTIQLAAKELKKK